MFFRAYGFQNNLETFGLISGLWTSAFALGAFIGPSVSGILYDGIGFRNASMFIFALHILVVSNFGSCYDGIARFDPPYVKYPSTKFPIHIPTKASKVGVRQLAQS